MPRARIGNTSKKRGSQTDSSSASTSKRGRSSISSVGSDRSATSVGSDTEDETPPGPGPGVIPPLVINRGKLHELQGFADLTAASFFHLHEGVHYCRVVEGEQSTPCRFAVKAMLGARNQPLPKTSNLTRHLDSGGKGHGNLWRLVTTLKQKGKEAPLKTSDLSAGDIRKYGTKEEPKFATITVSTTQIMDGKHILFPFL